MPRSTDIVLGYSHGYRWDDIAGFVESLRRTGYAGEICLFLSGTSEAAAAEIRAHGVRVEHSPHRRPRPDNSRSRHWPVARRLPELLRRAALRRIAQIAVLRFLLYERFLARHEDRYTTALLTDIRDVWFQADPFRSSPIEGVHVFEEARGRTIASEPHNTGWMREAFGDSILGRLGGEPIVCSGTILGEVSALRRFLAHFLRCFARARSIGPSGIDQGVFNYAVRTFDRGDLTIHGNGESTVLTMGIMPETDIRCDDEGRVVRPNGEVIPVLHQYDRHPHLATRLAERAKAPHRGPDAESRKV